MNKLLLCLNLILIISIAIHSMDSESKTLSKKELLKLFKEKNYQWKQTYFPIEESESKLEQIESVNGLHLTAFSRSVIARTNQLFFGFLESGPLNTVGFGVTGIQAGMNLYNESLNKKIQATKESIKIANENTKKIQTDLQFYILGKYLEIQYQQMKLEISEIAIKKNQEIFRLANEKNKSGLGIPIDVARSEVLIAKDKIKNLEIKNQLNKLKRELSLYLNIEDQIEIPKLKIKKMTKEKIKINDEEQSNIKITEYQLNTLEYLKSSIQSEKKLNIKTYAEVGTVGTQAFGLFNTLSGSAGIQFEIPLIDAGYNSGKKREILNQISNLKMEKEKFHRENLQKKEQSLSQIELTELILNESDVQLKYSITERDLAEKKIKYGSAGNFEYINAQTNYILALEANILAIYSYELSKLNLYYINADVDGYLNIDEEVENG